MAEGDGLLSRTNDFASACHKLTLVASCSRPDFYATSAYAWRRLKRPQFQSPGYFLGLLFFKLGSRILRGDFTANKIVAALTIS